MRYGALWLVVVLTVGALGLAMFMRRDLAADLAEPDRKAGP
jgi:hypothetical protein